MTPKIGDFVLSGYRAVQITKITAKRIYFVSSSSWRGDEFISLEDRYGRAKDIYVGMQERVQTLGDKLKASSAEYRAECDAATERHTARIAQAKAEFAEGAQ